MAEPTNQSLRTELYKRAYETSPDKANNNAIHEGAWLYYRYGYEDDEPPEQPEQSTKDDLQKPE